MGTSNEETVAGGVEPVPSAAEEEAWCAFEEGEAEVSAGSGGGTDDDFGDGVDFADFVEATDVERTVVDSGGEHADGGKKFGAPETHGPACRNGVEVVRSPGRSDAASLEISLSASLSEGAELTVKNDNELNGPAGGDSDRKAGGGDHDATVKAPPPKDAACRSDDEWVTNGEWETDQWNSPSSLPAGPFRSCPSTPAGRRVDHDLSSSTPPPHPGDSSVPVSPAGAEAAKARERVGSPHSWAVEGDGGGPSSRRRGASARRRSRQQLPPLGRAPRAHTEGSAGAGGRASAIVPREIAVSAPDMEDFDERELARSGSSRRRSSADSSSEHSRRRRYQHQARHRDRHGHARGSSRAYDSSALPDVTLESAVGVVAGAAAALKEQIGRRQSGSSLRKFFYTPDDDRARGRWSPRVDSGKKTVGGDIDTECLGVVRALAPPDFDAPTTRQDQGDIASSIPSLGVRAATVVKPDPSSETSKNDEDAQMGNQRRRSAPLHVDAPLEGSAIENENTKSREGVRLDNGREYVESLTTSPAVPMVSAENQRRKQAVRDRFDKAGSSPHQGMQRPPQDPGDVGAAGIVDPCTEEERRIIESFWKVYDDTVILSLFAIGGIVFRIIAASFFSVFDDTFNSTSALFANLPLNCLSCFLLGILCSGDDALKVVYTRMSVDRTGSNRRRESWRSAEDEMREVQLQALERRMRKASSLVLFPGKKEDVDVMEHYMDIGQSGRLQQCDGNGVGAGDEWEEWGEWQGDSFVNEGHEITGSGAQTKTPHPERERTRQNEDSFMSDIAEDMDESAGQERHEQYVEEGSVVRAGEPMTESGCNPSEEMGGGASSRGDVQRRGRRRMRRRRRGRRRHRLLAQNDPNSPRDAFDAADIGDVETGTRTVVNESQRTSDDVQSLSDGSDDQTDPTGTRDTIRTAQLTNAEHVGIASPRDSLHRDVHSVDSDNFSGIEQRDDRDLDQIFNEVTQNFTRLTRVNIADGWDVGTTPEAMSDDLLLGLRVGFCGCLSTFSSWNSSMISLLKNGHVTEAIVGYIIGLQLPIVSYRFGQHVAVYIFMWRVRRETSRAERRGGYGLRLRDSDDSDGSSEVVSDDSNRSEEGINIQNVASNDAEGNSRGRPRFYSDEDVGVPLPNSSSHTPRTRRRHRKKHGRILIEQQAGVTERETPSVRAVATALMLMTLVTLTTSIWFFNRPNQQKFAISLLFSPLGVFTRWKLLKYNKKRGVSSFPLGTFACNILGCALSGSLGSLLAGNPGPEESIVLVSIVSGFGGSLSSLAAFVVEVLALIDPLLFKYDGVKYAFITLFWAFTVGLITSQTRDWADEL